MGVYKPGKQELIIKLPLPRQRTEPTVLQRNLDDCLNYHVLVLIRDKLLSHPDAKHVYFSI